MSHIQNYHVAVGEGEVDGLRGVGPDGLISTGKSSVSGDNHILPVLFHRGLRCHKGGLGEDDPKEYKKGGYPTRSLTQAGFPEPLDDSFIEWFSFQRKDGNQNQNK